MTTTPKTKFLTCLAYQNMTFSHISYIHVHVCLAEDKACVENIALSYRFPTCTKSKFSSSGYCAFFQHINMRMCYGVDHHNNYWIHNLA